MKVTHYPISHENLQTPLVILMQAYLDNPKFLLLQSNGDGGYDDADGI